MVQGHKSKFVNVRFSEDEIKVLVQLENALGLSRTAYIRLKALGDMQAIVVNNRELLAALDNVGRQMNYIGNNINQLARHANTLQLKGELKADIISRFTELFREYLESQAALAVLMRKILRSTAQT